MKSRKKIKILWWTFLNSKFVVSSQNSTFGRKIAALMFTFVQILDNYRPNLITTPLSLSWAIFIYNIFDYWELHHFSLLKLRSTLAGAGAIECPAESSNDSYHPKNGYLCTFRLLEINNFCQKQLFWLKIQKVDFSQKSIIGFQKLF